MEYNKNNLKKGQKVTEKAIILEGALVLMKFVMGFLSGGLALISDAIHSGSDFVSIVTSWVGLRFAQKDPDEKFQYGYYKAENLGTLVISFLIIYAAFEMFVQGYSKLFEISDIRFPVAAMAISVVDAVVLFFFGRYEIKVGKEINAQSLVAMGKENRTHILTSMAIFVGTLSAYLNIPYIEGVVTMGISGLIFEIGFGALKDSAYALMDVSPSDDFRKDVEEAIDSVGGIEEYFDLRLRRSGPYIFGEVKVGIRKSVDVKRSAEISQKVEEAIRNNVNKVDSFVVHVEPYKSQYSHLVIPVENKDGMNSEIADCFGKAQYLLFVNLKAENVEGSYFLKNEYRDNEEKVGLALAKLAIEQKSEVVLTKNIGDISFHVLRDNLFDIFQVANVKASKAVEKFVQGELTQLKKPTKSVTKYD